MAKMLREKDLNGKPPKDILEFEDILTIVGGYGRYQKKLVYAFLIPTAMVMPFLCMNLIFLISTPDHWCRETALDVYNMTFNEKQELLRPIVMQEGHMAPSKCDMVNYTGILNDESDNDFMSLRNISQDLPVTKCVNGWEYDQSLYTSTASTQWNLVCENNHLPTLAFTINGIGSAIGTPIYGAVSDKFGRKLVYIMTIIIAILGSGLTVLVPTFLLFIVVRGFIGSTMPCAYQMPYLILLEIISPDKRAQINTISCFGWCVGLSLLPLTAYLSGDWIIFGWVCFAVIIPFIGYYWFLPESSRWLICKKRYEQSAKILSNVAKENGIHLSDGYILSVVEKLGENVMTKQEQESGTPLDLIRYPRTRLRFIIICLTWISCSMSYYAFHINVTHLAGNEFLNFFLLAIVEVPSYVVAYFLVQSPLGRRWCSVLSTLLMSAACFIPAISDVPIVANVASIIGKFGNCAAFYSLYQQAAELFPTPVRASGMGLAATASQLVSICTPYIIYLGVYARHIPFTVIAFTSLFAGIAAAFLPETLNENLPQTLLDGETFGRRKKFFCLAKPKKKENYKEEDSKMEMTAKI